MSQNIPYTRKGDIWKSRLHGYKPPGGASAYGLPPPQKPQNTNMSMSMKKTVTVKETVKVQEISGHIVILITPNSG